MPLPVSIVVVSRHRPAALLRCLAGIAQLDYQNFEVVIVACPAGQDAVKSTDHAPHLKTISFDQPNISVARNLGIAQAAGEVIAFIDDDAVPEPLWLHHLAAPFETGDIAAAGGFVIGRNGISFQWRARTVDTTGETTPLDVSDTHPTVLQPAHDSAIKTEGTNMALRRDVLSGLGGFDPAFHFFLDETDMNMRLAQAGHATAIVPLAQVHHGFEASDRRASDRTPRDLTQIGASQQAFLRKHCRSAARAPAWQVFRNGQRNRLLRAMQRGSLDPLDVSRLMRGLDQGARDGLKRSLKETPSIPRAASEFLAFPGRPGASRHTLTGRIWQAAKLRAEAARSAANGNITTLILLDPTARYHRLRFTQDGVWEQTGGLWGRSQRDAPLLQPWRFARRCDAEQRRTARVRGPDGFSICE
ncbi:GT2 family glycosyltransferase [Sagittula marina]|uniref:GT2 family glycosyltransferase n=1 Tax=Sagittula marina TaxID=943940 RepID=A0A7W6DRT0_9RHOB|nr:glycosyltransferase [Sagittula marina]MBB3983984.1 GT2 family glycosyltransferase [Sagittula marina]